MMFSSQLKAVTLKMKIYIEDVKRISMKVLGLCLHLVQASPGSRTRGRRELDYTQESCGHTTLFSSFRMVLCIFLAHCILLRDRITQ